MWGGFAMNVSVLSTSRMVRNPRLYKRCVAAHLSWRAHFVAQEAAGTRTFLLIPYHDPASFATRFMRQIRVKLRAMPPRLLLRHVAPKTPTARSLRPPSPRLRRRFANRRATTALFPPSSDHIVAKSPKFTADARSPAFRWRRHVLSAHQRLHGRDRLPHLRSQRRRDPDHLSLA